MKKSPTRLAAAFSGPSRGLLYDLCHGLFHGLSRSFFGSFFYGALRNVFRSFPCGRFPFPAALCAALSAGFLGSQPAFAHDAWVESRDGSWVVRYGHDDKAEPYAPEKLRALSAVDANGAALVVSLDLTASPASARVDGRPALLALHFDNGYWTKTTEGSKNLPKNEVPGALAATHSVKFGKTLPVWSAAATRPQGARLEIVPLVATAPRAGGTLPVRVLWDGRPLAGARLARAGHGKETPVEADAEGRAAVPVTAGRQMIVVNHKVELHGDARADHYSAAANLVFESAR